MLDGSELEFGMIFLIGGAGFAIFAIRLLIMDARKQTNGYVPKHAAGGNIDYVPPDYHPVYYANPNLDNPYPELWFDAVVKRGKYGHSEPFHWFIQKCEKKKRLAELRYRRIRRMELSNWKWLDVPWSEWKDLYPDRTLVNA